LTTIFAQWLILITEFAVKVAKNSVGGQANYVSWSVLLGCIFLRIAVKSLF